MKTIFKIVTMAVIGVVSAMAQETLPVPAPNVPPPPPAPVTVAAPDNSTLTMFHDSLAPYGRWRLVEPYGWVWSPDGVAVDWRPYTDGSWAYTDDGWTFVTDVPWGWAPFHYGRWFFHEHEGWCWAPDRVWGPAWVSWHLGDTWCGWAPLPPRVAVVATVEWDPLIPTFGWSFVGREDFLRPHLHDHIIVAARNVTLLRETRNVTRIEIHDAHVINASISVEQIERFTGHSVPHLRLADVHSPGEHGISGTELRVFRPEPRAGAVAITPRIEPVRPAAPSWEELRHKEAERAHLEAAQRAQHDALETLHQQELQRPPAGISPAEIQQRHEAEHQAFSEQMAREHQLLEHRAGPEPEHARPERAFAAPPRARGFGR